MDELERDAIGEEAPEEAAIEEEPADEAAIEEAVAEEEAIEEAVIEEEPPEEPQPEQKPGRPIKGPRFWAWALAVLLMLYGLLMLAPALWNAVLSAAALTGLVSEAGRRYDSAMEAYELLYSLEQGAQGMGLDALGLSSGNFLYERQFAMVGKLDGPLALVLGQDVPPISYFFPGRVPGSLRKLNAVSGELEEILLGFYAQLDLTPEPAEGQSESKWALGALEAARALDGRAGQRALYYDALALYYAANYPEEKQANLARVEALKKAPCSEFWMYENIALYHAFEDDDYDALAALYGAHAKRSREDYLAMQRRVRALYLSAGEAEALKAAKKYARRPQAKPYMELARAEILYRQGKYDEAIALCDGVISRAVPMDPSASGMGDVAAMEAVAVKAAVLLLQGEAGRAAALMEAAQENPYGRMSLNFPYTLLAAYAVNGDWEGEAAQNLLMMLLYNDYAVPQAVAALAEGSTTVEKIFTEGWGGFDA
ncbi:MAG: hypothetical protein FWE98_06960 [Oscillospiraceae bacterium]|nr:hypothetical protein [Oscillospiraceae bacterium]